MDSRETIYPQFENGGGTDNNQNSAEGGVAPGWGKSHRTWLLNKFISFLAVLIWKSDKN